MFKKNYLARNKFYLEPRSFLPKIFHNRHDKTQLQVKNAIADFIKEYAHYKKDLLEVGGFRGYQTFVYRDKLNTPGRTVIYDWKDFRAEEIKSEIEFYKVDLEKQKFPDIDSSFDIVVCNQVLEHLKNVFTPMSEIYRVLRPGGYLIVSVPNLSALHNCLYLALGGQPTTLHLFGDHIRGFAIWSMSKFLALNGHFRILKIKGYGLHPFTSKPMPGPLRTFCHTPIWFCQKQQSSQPLWEDIQKSKTTKHDTILRILQNRS